MEVHGPDRPIVAARGREACYLPMPFRNGDLQQVEVEGIAQVRIA